MYKYFHPQQKTASFHLIIELILFKWLKIEISHHLKTNCVVYINYFLKNCSCQTYCWTFSSKFFSTLWIIRLMSDIWHLKVKSSNGSLQKRLLKLKINLKQFILLKKQSIPFIKTLSQYEVIPHTSYHYIHIQVTFGLYFFYIC